MFRRSEEKWEEEARAKLEEIYQIHGNLMMQVAMSVLHQRQDAEDAVQNGIISIARHMDTIGEVQDFRTISYVKTVVRNASIDIYRKKQKGDVSYDELIIEPIDTYDMEQTVCNQTEVQRVIEVIDGLDTEYREVLSLFYVNELTPREIADVLNRSYNTVRSQVNRGKKILRKSLE